MTTCPSWLPIGPTLAALLMLRLVSGPTPSPPAEADTAWVSPFQRRVLTLDRSPTAATLVWLQTCVLWSADARAGTPPRAGVRAAQHLDPRFRAAASYGAVMLAASHEPEAQIEVLTQAIHDFPEDPWFPVALALSDAQAAADPSAPARWMAHAAALPNAPEFLTLAAARLANP